LRAGTRYERWMPSPTSTLFPRLMATVAYAPVSTQDEALNDRLERLRAAGADPIYREKINGARVIGRSLAD
jgi:hypothetical protein